MRSSNILVKSCQEWQKKTLPLRSIVPVYRPVNFDSEALQFRPLQQKTKGYKPADQSLSQGLKPAERPITLCATDLEKVDLILEFRTNHLWKIDPVDARDCHYRSDKFSLEGDLMYQR